MLGAYVAYSAGTALGAYADSPLGILVGGAAGRHRSRRCIGALIERLLLRRLYAAPELLQLTATFGVVLIVRDATLALWGAEDRLGPRVAGLDGVVQWFGRAIPQYDVFLLIVGPVVLIALTLLMRRTRFGLLVRAASENRVLAGALGIDERKLFTTVFALGAFLAGLAGALTLPREPANLGMDLAVIADAFVVTVLGGLGSIPGAFVAAIIIGVTKALCIAAGTVDDRRRHDRDAEAHAGDRVHRDGAGAARAPARACSARRGAVRRRRRAARARADRAGRRDACAVAAVVARRSSPLLLPLAGDEYALVLATDMLIAALFTASLHFMTGTGGMASFGHAAYFGIGAYASALAATHGYPFVAALALAPVAAASRRSRSARCASALSGIYLAMLTLAFAQIVWSIALQWDAVTGGSNGITGVWPPDGLPNRTRFYLFVLCIGGGRPCRARRHRVHAIRLCAARQPRFAAARSSIGHRRARAADQGAGTRRRLRRPGRRPLRFFEGRHRARRARDSALGRCARDDVARRPERARSVRCSAPRRSRGCRTHWRARPSTGAPASVSSSC